MFNKNIKLVLAVAVFAWAIYQFIESNIMNGISLVLLAGIFVLLYLKMNLFYLLFYNCVNKILLAQQNG